MLVLLLYVCSLYVLLCVYPCFILFLVPLVVLCCVSRCFMLFLSLFYIVFRHFKCLVYGSRNQSLHMVAEFVAPTASGNHGGDATAEQGRRQQQQQLMETVRHKQVQTHLQQRQILEALFQEHKQTHQQARQPQGAPPTATAGMEKQFQHQQLNTRGSITSTRCGEVKTSGKTGRGKSRRPWQG